jgi:hypothetical protein
MAGANPGDWSAARCGSKDGHANSHNGPESFEWNPIGVPDCQATQFTCG